MSEAKIMPSKNPTVLPLWMAVMFSLSMTVQADTLNPEQEKIVQEYLSKLPAEQIEQVRHDPNARLEFLRSVASSMTPEQRAAFRDCWKSMSLEERQQALLKY
jgi:ABC-type transporter MlaC component